LRILTYIKGSPDKVLFYKKHGYLLIESSSDSNYARNKKDRKHTSSYCTYIGGNLVTWSKKSVVSHYSAEAEYRPMAHTTYGPYNM